MQPDSYLRDRRRKSKIAGYGSKIAKTVVFAASLLVVAPSLHELGHILTLIAAGCEFSTGFDFIIPVGLTGTVQPLCYLNPTSSFIFYASGHLTVLAVAAVFLTHYEYKDSFYSGLAGTGFLLSIPSALAYYGDIFNAGEALGLSRVFPAVFSIFLLLGVSITALRVLEKLFDQNGSSVAPGSP